MTDAHALIWAATGQLKRLGRVARRFYERVNDRRALLYVPTIALVEIGEAHHAGHFSLGMPFDHWLTRLLGSGQYVAADLTPEVVARAQQLFAIPERGDRLIAATASVLDLPLITRDESISDAAAVDCLW
ncbi:MAG: PIN domain-containing protein [Gemmatimonadaceae bacterium]